MKVRSKTELVGTLDQEMSWRKKELTTLRFLLEGCREHQLPVILRAATCILYAHWEGFIKAAAVCYITFVASRGLRYGDLTPNFVALGFRTDILEAGSSDRPSIHTALAGSLIAGLGKLPIRDWDPIVNVQSNLNFANLQEISCLLGLDNHDYLSKQHLLDERLLKNRNLAAHGRHIEIDSDDYLMLHEEVIQLLQRFRNDVENAAVTESFRR